MAPVSLLDLVSTLPATDGWGPPPSTETTLDGVPYAPYSKADKLGRMADWTEGKDRERGGRQQYGNRNYRDQQIYGAGQTNNPFAIQVAEEEATFSVVDNTRTSARGRGFGRGGGTVFRGRGQRGAATQRGGRGTFQRVGGGRGGQGGYDSRGGRGGRGGRRFGYRDDKPQRNRDASIQVKPDWTLLEEIDFARLTKLSLDTPDGDDIDSYGFLYFYDRSYDKQPGTKTSERKLQVLERAAYNVTTSSDPIIQELAEKEEGTIFATDSILSMLMCAPRSVYSWDLVITRQGDKVFIDKREGSTLDMVTVNENAADAPLELSEGNKDTINSPGALMMEATHINNVFPIQVVVESETAKREMPNEHPFYNPAEETDPAASKAYKYRRFDLSLAQDEEPMHLIVRTELDAVLKNNISGEDQFLTIKALNEFDSKAPGSGGALDWRSKLASQRGAVVATEMKNNSCKLARWTVQSILAKADMMKLGFVSRINPRNPNDHMILGVLGYKPRDFAAQMNLNLANGWGIVRTIVDMVLKMGDGKYVLVKDPNKNVLRLYSVPVDTFEEEEAAPIKGDDAVEE
ncbi:translation initiation factor eIF-3, subunit D [Trichodelitschia bisporula]|uniref:Eukaryotic translation initiation factor 3 subunit D n=1 Tax=Trichodelitschia bisporula TaxID=703511 RepID=A0A6G1HWV4_9PEZI|nr:translation initiation factor eIF-3, subunit D [Trichodelitschia bisporula]